MNNIMSGVCVGTVKSNKLDAEGRIEITLEGVAGNAGPYPARIATLMAGNGYGTLFLPEENDQVLVAFVNGSINEPIVIGGVWSKVDKPPDANADGKNTTKLIKTRAGNEIRITDKNSAEKIEITGKEGKTRVVLDIANKTIEIMTEKITLNGNVDVTGKLVVGSSSKTTIDGNKITGS